MADVELTPKDGDTGNDASDFEADSDLPALNRTMSTRVSLRLAEKMAVQSELLVLEILPDGPPRTPRRMARLDILREVRERSLLTGSLSHHEENQLHVGLQLRDMRLVVPSVMKTSAVFAVRAGTILISMEQINAIILSNSMYLILPDGADSLLQVIDKNMKTHAEDNVEMPFELRAVETVLMTVCELFQVQTQTLLKEAKELLVAVRDRTSQRKLDRLRCLKNNVDLISKKLENAKKALDEMISKEDEMSMMYLSRRQNNPNPITSALLSHAEQVVAASTPVSARSARASLKIVVEQLEGNMHEHDEVELLLEHYVTELEENQGRIAGVISDIENTETLLTMKLDDNRNKLLKLEALFTMFAMLFALGALITGIFGMNLKNNAETDYSAFITTVIVMIAAQLLLFMGIGRYMRQRGLLNI